MCFKEDTPRIKSLSTKKPGKKTNGRSSFGLFLPTQGSTLKNFHKSTINSGLKYRLLLALRMFFLWNTKANACKETHKGLDGLNRKKTFSNLVLKVNLTDTGPKFLRFYSLKHKENTLKLQSSVDSIGSITWTVALSVDNGLLTKIWQFYNLCWKVDITGPELSKTWIIIELNIWLRIVSAHCWPAARS